MVEDLQGKVIMITGASSGLGKQLAMDAAKRGATVVLLARSTDKLKEITRGITELTGRLAYYETLHVDDSEQVNEVFLRIISDIGVPDVLINNAGFAVFDNLVDADMLEIKEMLNVNVLGVITCTKAVLPFMLERKKGHIINIASQAGKIATPKSSVYAATKHAVLGLTNSLRLELSGTNIIVTAVNPGPIQTAFFERADKSGTYVKNVGKLMLSVEDVSGRVINLIVRPKRELNLPWWMSAATTLYQIAPVFVEKVAGKKFHQK